ncbi:MAG: B12-binding domain-containing radical SAM protein [Magnetospirillum sp. WYHS-4]
MCEGDAMSRHRLAVLLVNSLSDRGRPMEPVALAQLAAVLRVAGFGSRILSCSQSADGIEQILSIIAIDQPAVVGMTMWSQNAAFVLEICRAIKAQFPETVTVVGGYAVPRAVRTPDPSVNVYVIGEGELPLLRVIQEVTRGICPPPVLGPEPANVMLLPTPARDLVDFEQIPFLEELDHPALLCRRCSFVFTYRGCPASCSFCAMHEVYGRVIRKRPIESIMAELEDLVEMHGINAFINEEDMLFTDKSRVMAWCGAIEASQHEFVWTCSGNVRCMDAEMLRALRRAGCKYIFLGSISGSDRILKEARAGFTVEHLDTALRIAAEAGMPVSSSFLVGFPGETKETLDETAKFILRNRDLYWDVGIGIIRPFDGAPLAARDCKREDGGATEIACEDLCEDDLCRFIERHTGVVNFTF